MRHERFGLLCVSVPVFLSKPVVRGNGKAVATLAGTFMGGGFSACVRTGLLLFSNRCTPSGAQVCAFGSTGMLAWACPKRRDARS